MSAIDDARALKQRWHNLLSAEVCGYGIANMAGNDGEGWGLKINTRWEPQGEVPTEIDGIPVVVECVGLVLPALTTEVPR